MEEGYSKMIDAKEAELGKIYDCVSYGRVIVIAKMNNLVEVEMLQDVGNVHKGRRATISGDTQLAY